MPKLYPEGTGPACEFDVAIVGAGPVGLCAAIELGLRGRRVLLLEKSSARGPQPRAKTLNMRSLTHFRRWGIADRVRAASPVADDLPRDVVFQTRLYGHHIVTVPNVYFRGSEKGNDPRFCEASEWIPQHVVEEVLRDKAASMPNISVRYGVEVLGLTQSDDQVQIEIAGSSEHICAAWVIGADGARSVVREKIGAVMTGRHAFACNYNMVLKIPALTANPPVNRGLMHWTLNADSPVVMGPIGDSWYIAKALEPGITEMSRDEIAICVHQAVGHAVDFEILSIDPWYAHQLVADRYRCGRIFLAGDACHLHPPFGGYGMNMGISDAVDLAWKIDAALGTWGGERLLDSYEFERRRVHEWTIEEAVENYGTLSRDLLRPGLEADSEAGAEMRDAVAQEILRTKKREFHTIGLVLGYHYAGSPVMACADQMARPSTEEYAPVVDCGALAPHIWMAAGDALYDRFGLGFTLLDTGSEDVALSKDLIATAAIFGIPLTTLRITEDAVQAVYGHRLVLIRPDQHIAWFSGCNGPLDAESILNVVTGRDMVEAEPASGWQIGREAFEN